MDSMLTGKIIADKRKELGLNQIQLAEKLNVSNRTISKWENGDGFPDVSILPELSKALDITIDELLTGTTPEPVIIEKVKENVPDLTEKARAKFLINEIIAFALVIVSTIIGTVTEVALFNVKPFYVFVEIYLIVGTLLLLTIGIVVYFTGLIKYKMEAERLTPSIILQNYIIVVIGSFAPACMIYHMLLWLRIINAYLIFNVAFAVLYVIALIISAIIIAKYIKVKKNEKAD